MNNPSIITSPQTCTTSWVDLGDEIDVSQYRRTGIWLDVDINDSANVRVRALAKLAPNAVLEYTPVIKTISATDIGIIGGYYELTSDTDQQVYFELETNGLIPVIQWQVQIGTDGGVNAIILSAQATYSVIPN